MPWALREMSVTSRQYVRVSMIDADLPGARTAKARLWALFWQASRYSLLETAGTCRLSHVEERALVAACAVSIAMGVPERPR
jgi:hypothetical protein